MSNNNDDGMIQKVACLQMENTELKLRVELLEERVSELVNENCALKASMDLLVNENRISKTKQDELRASLDLVVRKYTDLEKLLVPRATNTTDQPTQGEAESCMPKTIPKNETEESIEELEEQFANLAGEKLAAQMWHKSIAGIGQMSGPDTVSFLEKQMSQFEKFIDSMSAKGNFCDAVQETAMTRKFSKGISKKLKNIASRAKISE